MMEYKRGQDSCTSGSKEGRPVNAVPLSFCVTIFYMTVKTLEFSYPDCLNFVVCEMNM